MSIALISRSQRQRLGCHLKHTCGGPPLAARGGVGVAHPLQESALCSMMGSRAVVRRWPGIWYFCGSNVSQSMVSSGTVAHMTSCGEPIDASWGKIICLPARSSFEVTGVSSLFAANRNTHACHSYLPPPPKKNTAHDRSFIWPWPPPPQA